MECDNTHFNDIEYVKLESKAFLHEQLGLVNQSTNSIKAEEFSGNTDFIKFEPLDEVDEDSTVANNDVLVRTPWYSYDTLNNQNIKVRRRRRSDLSRKTHNAREQSNRVRNESEEQRAKRTSRSARWIALKRQTETLEQRAARLEKNRIRVRLRRKNEREALERYQRLFNTDSDCTPKQQEKIAEEIIDENEITRRIREQPENVVDGTIPEVHALMAVEEIMEKRKITAKKALFRRHNETPEQRAARLEREKIRVREKRRQEDEKQKLIRRIKNSESAARRRRNASEEQNEKRKAKEREYKRKKRQTETPEKREERLKRENIRIRQKRLLKKLQKRMVEGDETLSLKKIYAQVDQLAQNSEEREQQKSPNPQENLETTVKSESALYGCERTFSIKEMYATVQNWFRESKIVELANKSSQIKEEVGILEESDPTLCPNEMNAHVKNLTHHGEQTEKKGESSKSKEKVEIKVERDLALNDCKKSLETILKIEDIFS